MGLPSCLPPGCSGCSTKVRPISRITSRVTECDSSALPGFCHTGFWLERFSRSWCSCPLNEVNRNTSTNLTHQYSTHLSWRGLVSCKNSSSLCSPPPTPRLVSGSHFHFDHTHAKDALQSHATLWEGEAPFSSHCTQVRAVFTSENALFLQSLGGCDLGRANVSQPCEQWC